MKKLLLCLAIPLLNSQIYPEESCASKKTKALIPLKMQVLFNQIDSDWEQEKATGWLQVRNSEKKVIGEVLVMLSGKSYYDLSITPKDYAIDYVGYDSKGQKHNLSREANTRGLYYWCSGQAQLQSGKIKPAPHNIYKDQEFDYNQANKTWISKTSSVIWDPARELNHYPSSEIESIVR